MDPLIARHLPLITNRISFSFNPSPSLPSLTNRKEFLDTRDSPLTAIAPSKPNTPILPKTSFKYSPSVQFVFEMEKVTYKGCGEEDEDDEDEITEITEGLTRDVAGPNQGQGQVAGRSSSAHDSLTRRSLAT